MRTDMVFDSPLNDTDLEASDLELVIVFSEADAAFGNHLITGESLNDWKNAPRVGATSSNFVTVTVIDEYGDPVRGVSVRTNSALNVAGQDVVSVFPFVQYYTTNRSGQYSIGYAYGGGPASENLLVVADDTPADDESQRGRPSVGLTTPRSVLLRQVLPSSIGLAPVACPVARTHLSWLLKRGGTCSS